MRSRPDFPSHRGSGGRPFFFREQQETRGDIDSSSFFEEIFFPPFFIDGFQHAEYVFFLRACRRRRTRFSPSNRGVRRRSVFSGRHRDLPRPSLLRLVVAGLPLPLRVRKQANSTLTTSARVLPSLPLPPRREAGKRREEAMVLSAQINLSPYSLHSFSHSHPPTRVFMRVQWESAFFLFSHLGNGNLVSFFFEHSFVARRAGGLNSTEYAQAFLSSPPL